MRKKRIFWKNGKCNSSIAKRIRLRKCDGINVPKKCPYYFAKEEKIIETKKLRVKPVKSRKSKTLALVTGLRHLASWRQKVSKDV